MRLAVTGTPLTKRKSQRALSTAQRKLLEALLNEPGSTFEELVAEGIYDCKANVERALSGLIARGLVAFTRGQKPSYTVTYTAKRLLLTG
jgi:predicted transcriptional regulator